KLKRKTPPRKQWRRAGGSLAGLVARLWKRQEGAARRRQTEVSCPERDPIEGGKGAVRTGFQDVAIEFRLLALEFPGTQRVARSGQRGLQPTLSRTRIDRQYRHASAAARRALRVKVQFAFRRGTGTQHD